jgi:hypothetical protein
MQRYKLPTSIAALSNVLDSLKGEKLMAIEEGPMAGWLYRTAAGFRLLFTDTLYEPTSNEVRRLLEELGSDMMYRRLTTKQACFRARLTAKPWRIGCNRPPNRYPWKDAEAKDKYRKWQRDYETKAGAYGVCELLDVFGRDCGDDKIRTIVALHDKHTCKKPGAALA